jgi:hypothetical protein
MSKMALSFVLGMALCGSCYGDVDAGLLALNRGDVQAALKEFRASAELGDPKAQLWLGRAHEQLEGLPHDYAEAMRWYRRASDQQYGEATFAVGELYEAGRGVRPSRTEAEKWYELAAKQGYHKQELTLLFVRWRPGTAALHVENPREASRTLSSEEMKRLEGAGLRGTLQVQGSAVHEKGLRSRAVIVLQGPVTTEIRLPQPDHSNVILVQRENGWSTLPPDAPTLQRSILLSPQRTFTLATVGYFAGGQASSAAFVWE